MSDKALGADSAAQWRMAGLMRTRGRKKMTVHPIGGTHLSGRTKKWTETLCVLGVGIDYSICVRNIFMNRCS